MSVEWEEVWLYDTFFEDGLTPFGLWGGFLWLSVGKGTKVYRCRAKAATTPDAAYLADDGEHAVDQPGTAFSETHPAALLTHRTSKRINNSSKDFEVTLEFNDPTGGSAVEDLLALPAQISWVPRSGTEEYAKDEDSPRKPVVNWAFEPFDRLPTRDMVGRIYTVVKYVDDAGRAAIEAAEGCNNQNVELIDSTSHDVNTLLLKAAFERVQGIHKATMTIEYNPRGFEDEILQVGFTQLITDPDSGFVIRVDIAQQDKDGNWQPVTKPWPLNSDGTAKDNAGDTIESTAFYAYPLAAWTGVPLE